MCCQIGCAPGNHLVRFKEASARPKQRVARRSGMPGRFRSSAASGRGYRGAAFALPARVRLHGAAGLPGSRARVRRIGIIIMILDNIIRFEADREMPDGVRHPADGTWAEKGGLL